jgi:flagellar protein FlgJ
MLKESPRYAGVAAQAAQSTATAASAADFAQGLQKAGYATDPAYADKLTRVINATLRVTRAAA